MAGKVVSKGMLARVDRLLGFLDAATRSLQTDFSSVGEMKDVGSSFRSIGLDNIKFVTVPWQYSPEDPNRVEWLPEADKLWRKVMPRQAAGRQGRHRRDLGRRRRRRRRGIGRRLRQQPGQGCGHRRGARSPPGCARERTTAATAGPPRRPSSDGAGSRRCSATCCPTRPPTSATTRRPSAGRAATSG